MNRIKMDDEAVAYDKHLCELMSNAVGMQSFGRLVNLSTLLLMVQRVFGDVVEFGCYLGHTGELMRALTGRRVWLYDSFQGNPKPGPEDHIPDDAEGYYKEGGNKISIDDLSKNITIQFYGDGPVIVPKFFEDLKPEDLPERIAFAHFDCNFYSGTKAALSLALPRMMPGSVGVIDDYHHAGLPGVKAACDEVLKQNVWTMLEPGGEQACHVYFVKL